MRLRFAPKGQLHPAQGRVLERQRKDGTLGTQCPSVSLRPARAAAYLIALLCSCPCRAHAIYCPYDPGRCPGLGAAGLSARSSSGFNKRAPWGAYYERLRQHSRSTSPRRDPTSSGQNTFLLRGARLGDSRLLLSRGSLLPLRGVCFWKNYARGAAPGCVLVAPSGRVCLRYFSWGT